LAPIFDTNDAVLYPPGPQADRFLGRYYLRTERFDTN
jgi:hypothetical protein